MYCSLFTLLQCYFAIEMATKLRCYYIICVQCTALTVRHTVMPLIRFVVVYVLFPCKRVAAFPFVGLRISHLNTWPFDRIRSELTSKHSTHVRRAPAVKTEPLQ